MRQVWYAACGAMDRDVRNRAFWRSALGEELSEGDVIAMHPLRRMERAGSSPERAKTPEEKALDSEVGWKLIRQHLTQKRGK